jgi:protein-tyrosine phosphatase
VILVVCTANQCRSPLAAAMLRARLFSRAVDEAVESAGLGASGYPATAPTIEAATRAGYDLSGHRSTRIGAGQIARADLVLGMERRHVREAVALAPGAWPRAFTLRELVRRGDAIGPRAPDEGLASWLGRVHADRRPADMLGTSRDDDVADPTGDPLADYDSTARVLDELVTRVVVLAWPR